MQTANADGECRRRMETANAEGECRCRANAGAGRILGDCKRAGAHGAKADASQRGPLAPERGHVCGPSQVARHHGHVHGHVR